MWVKLKVRRKTFFSFFLFFNSVFHNLCDVLSQLNKQLERCLSSINAGLLKHKIILGVDDRGKLSCHKVNLCFIYFDPQECIVS